MKTVKANSTTQTQRFNRTALAAAVSLGVFYMSTPALADAVPRGKVRLELSETISSRPAVPDDDFDGRLAVDGLIQSHPDPQFARLEERYRSLPPFTEAREDSPEQYVAEATARERLTEQVKEVAGELTRFVPHISSSLRYEDVRSESGSETGGAPVRISQSTALATVSPTFEYQRPIDRWHLKATYNYARKQYFLEQSTSLNNHNVKVNATRPLQRGSEFAVTSGWVNTHDRNTNDPIAQSAFSQTSDTINNTSYTLNLAYKKGTPRDRTRILVSSFNERASLDTAIPGGDWQLSKHGLNASYTWQARRQLALAVEGKYVHSDYDIDSRDNDLARLMAGTDVILGRRLRTNLRLGYEQKTFNQSVAGDTIRVPVWRGSVEWLARRRTTLKLETGREFFEQTAGDEPIDNDRYNVQEWLRTSWRERWTERFSTEVALVRRTLDYKGQSREDAGNLLNLSASYQLSEKLKLAFNSSFAQQSSDFGTDVSSRAFTLQTDYSL